MTQTRTSSHWTRTNGAWSLAKYNQPIARLERAGEGWLCYARDTSGTEWFVGAAGKLASGKAALEAFCRNNRPLRPVLRKPRFIGTEAPM